MFCLASIGAGLAVSGAAGSSGWVISTFAGSGKNFGATGGYGGDGGPATRAQLRAPSAIAVDSRRDVFIADHLNNAIRKVAPTGAITTVAHADSPSGVAADTGGNVYYEDGAGVYKASPDGTVTPFAGTSSTSYDLGDGGPAPAPH